jgi:hypothetical protein
VGWFARWRERSGFGDRGRSARAPQCVSLRPSSRMRGCRHNERSGSLAFPWEADPLTALSIQGSPGWTNVLRNSTSALLSAHLVARGHREGRPMKAATKPIAVGMVSIRGRPRLGALRGTWRASYASSSDALNHDGYGGRRDGPQSSTAGRSAGYGAARAVTSKRPTEFLQLKACFETGNDWWVIRDWGLAGARCSALSHPGPR